MPRRGEHRREFPSIAEPQTAVDRIGVRAVEAPDRTGATRTLTLDPNEFQCAALAAQLADEWVDYVEIAQLTGSSATTTRRAILDFCNQIDRRLGDHAQDACLSRPNPDVAGALADWERTLPTRFPTGATTPSTLAAAVRSLIARRAQHDHRPITAGLRRLVDGEVGVAAGSTQEIDEFSRADKRSLVRAAWEWVNRLDLRVSEGWAAAARGHHPDEHGWTQVDNLLWGLACGQVNPRQIREHLPAVHEWPPQLRAYIEADGRPVCAARAKETLVRWLVQQLYPSPLDLHAYRILLVAATGHSPEEITALSVDDVEVLPSGVRLTLTKRRARRIRHRTFGTEPPASVPSEPVEFTDRPHHEVRAIIERLTRVGEPVRRNLPDRRHLFMAATVTADCQLRMARWNYNRPRARFSDWLTAAGVTVEGTADVRRLRKSTKVEKALAFGGRVADAANDHHEEVFRGHYAQGTTLRMMSGRVIATAQDHWFTKALEGPTVLTEATDVLESPDQAGLLGLTSKQAEELRRGALDMGLAQCSDPANSPYGRPGQLCPVAPLRCLECRNAWVLPSNLPQLLLFADHLDRLRLRISPQHFAELWGQSHTNLQAVLAERTDEEKALARKHIQTGEAALHLPLAVNVEFDQ